MIVVQGAIESTTNALQFTWTALVYQSTLELYKWKKNNNFTNAQSYLEMTNSFRYGLIIGLSKQFFIFPQQVSGLKTGIQITRLSEALDVEYVNVNANGAFSYKMAVFNQTFDMLVLCDIFLGAGLSTSIYITSTSVSLPTYVSESMPVESTDVIVQ